MSRTVPVLSIVSATSKAAATEESSIKPMDLSGLGIYYKSSSKRGSVGRRR